MSGFPASEPLPSWDAVEPTRLAALRTPEQQVLTAASSFLAQHDQDHLIPLRPLRTDRGWIVSVEGAEASRTLELTFDLEVEPPAWLAA